MLTTSRTESRTALAPAMTQATAFDSGEFEHG